MPSERTAPAHLLPSYSGMGQTRETARPLQGAGEAVLPQGRLRSAEQRRMCIRVHVVLHADGLLSQHIRQSSGSSVTGREAWHVGLACCRPWGRKELDTTERPNWTDGTNQLFKNLK